LRKFLLLPFLLPLAASLVVAGAQSSAFQTSANSHDDSNTPCPALANQIEITTDTNGVDFCPYLHGTVLPAIRSTWIRLMPDEAQAPIAKPGHVVVEFFIYSDGSIRDLRLVGTSGDPELDRAAWSSIAASSPVEPLPFKFRGKKLGLHIHFYYNSGPGSDAPARDGAVRAGGPVLAPVLVHSKPASYPRSAKGSGSVGTVWLSLIVGTNGKPRDIIVIKSVSPELDEEAIRTVGKWRFHPGTLAGKSVAVEVSEEVTFTLN